MAAGAFHSPRIWNSYLLLWISGLLSALWPVPAITGCILVFLADRRLWHIVRIGAGCVAFAAGWGIAFFNVHAYMAAEAPQWAMPGPNKSPVRICGDVEAAQWLPGGRLRVILSGVRPAADETAEPLPGLCAWTWEEPGLAAPLPGQSACIAKPVRHASGFANFQETDVYNLARGTRWRIWSAKDQGHPVISGSPDRIPLLRARLRASFLEALGHTEEKGISQAKAILLALVFGDRGFLDQATVNEFSAAALAHSLALSGQHLCIAGLLAAGLAIMAGRLIPGLYLRTARIRLIALLGIPFALAYLWLGNFPPSLLRAVCMMLVFGYFVIRGRPHCGIDILAAAILMILLASPLAVLDLGLQFSALCVFIIIASAPAINSGLGRIFKAAKGSLSSRIGAGVAGILAYSFVIQAALLPVSLNVFDNAGLLFPLNALWLPALAFWTLPLAFAGLGLSLLPGCLEAASAILALAAAPCTWLLELLDWFAKKGFLDMPAFLHPHWSAILAFLLLLVSAGWIYGSPAIAAGHKKARMLIGAGLALLCLGPILREASFFDDKVYVEAPDVGQGQAVIVKFPGNGRLVIDGGGSRSARFDPGKNIVAPVLTDNLRPELAAVFNTHPDLDHLGGLFYLLKSFSVGKLFHNGHEGSGDLRKRWIEEQKRSGAITLYAGDEIAAGEPGSGLKLEVLHPPANPDRPWRGNSASLVLRLVRNGEGLALFTGDAEKATLKYLLDSGADLRAKVVFAPHHGSDRSLVTNFYKAAKPEVVAVSCGYENRWNYPGRKLQGFLAQTGIPIVDTGNFGRISFAFSEDGNLAKLRTIKGSAPAVGTADKKR